MEAVARAVELLAERVKREEHSLVFLGETHRLLLTDHTEFLNFVLNLAEALRGEFKYLFVEFLGGEFSTLFSDFLLGRQSLAAYRDAVRTGIFTDAIPDYFFNGLKLLHEQGLVIVPINSRGRGRDRFMADTILDNIAGTQSKGIVWCGFAHGARRHNQPPNDWRSCLELLEAEQQKCFSVAEVSRKHYLMRERDVRLEPLLNGVKQIGVLFRGNYELMSNWVIGSSNLASDFPGDVFTGRMLFRMRHFDSIFLDTNHFDGDSDEERRGNANSFSDIA